MGNLQRRLLSSKARGICFLLPTAVNIGLLLLSLCSTVQLCRAFLERKINTKRTFTIIYLSHFSLIFFFLNQMKFSLILLHFLLKLRLFLTDALSSDVDGKLITCCGSRAREKFSCTYLHGEVLCALAAIWTFFKGTPSTSYGRRYFSLCLILSSVHLK